MPNRPDDMTPEFLAQCEQAFDQSAEVPPYAKRGPVRTQMLEIFTASTWLLGNLIDIGCPEALAQQICFSHGQLCLGRDPWDVADNLLGNYHKGFYPLPGQGLTDAEQNQTEAPLGKAPPVRKPE